MAKAKPTHIELPTNFLTTERGHTMLTADDGALAAWINLGNGYHLEITDTPGNSPRLNVAVTASTPAQLRKHIVTNLKGWSVVRWNLSGKAPVDKNSEVV